MGIIDFQMVPSKLGNYDLVQNATTMDFEHVTGFDTLFLYQILLDRRGTKFDTAAPRERGGWIGDLVTKQNGYESGSFIWTKRQSRVTQKDVNEVAALAQSALEYFVDIGAAKKVTAVVNGNTINGTITVDSNTVSSFLALWQNIGKVG